MAKHKIEVKKKEKSSSSSAGKHSIRSSGRARNRQRLQKVMATAGVGSRRACEELILEGAVRVNGKVVDHLPAFVDADSDTITVNDRKIRQAEKVYFLLNKPKCVICTNHDPYGRKKAIDLIECKERIFCVGRLDIDTTGAIILTNDSELANRLTHPRYELDKTYEVKVKGRIDGDAIDKLKKGVWLSEGKTGKAAVRIIKRSHNESLVQITIRQGLNRQVRRSLAKVGFKVKALRRTKIGDISLRGLNVGAYKKLSKGRIAYLKRITGL
jgi:23S rRNA pseudouridine2605 synthase